MCIYEKQHGIGKHGNGKYDFMVRLLVMANMVMVRLLVMVMVIRKHGNGNTTSGNDFMVRLLVMVIRKHGNDKYEFSNARHMAQLVVVNAQ